MELNKVYNEDCLEGMKRIADKSVDMILCDLPYGITQCKWDARIPLDKLWPIYERIIKDNGAIVLFADEPYTSCLIAASIYDFKYRITWDKASGGGHLNAKKMPLKQTEDICVFCKRGLNDMTYNPQFTIKPIQHRRGDRTRQKRKPFNGGYTGKTNGQLSESYDDKISYPTNLIKINAKTGECNSINRKHPTQKPVALFEYLIKTYTNEGETVLDNCMGSGTSAIACINTNRNYIGFEKEEKYYQIIQDRIKKHTPQLNLFNKAS